MNYLAYTTKGVKSLNTISRPPFPSSPEEQLMFEKMMCNTLESSPSTPDLKTPDMEFWREVNHTDYKLTMPDGVQCSIWLFEDVTDPVNGIQWPSKALRFQENKVVHSHLKVRHGTHTIHHHGLEPESINDGVGHISMEVQNTYTYQLTLRENVAGTYFYHCHRNTPLHFEMGMYGALIVDPVEGQGTLYSGGPKYDQEYIWAVDDIDPWWRQMSSGVIDPNTGAFTPGPTDGTPENKFGIDCATQNVPWYGCLDPVISAAAPYNPGMSTFNPKYFVISGVPAPLAPNRPLITDPKVAVTCAGGERVLIRIIHAAYELGYYKFGIDVEVAAIDARPLTGGRNLPKHKRTKYCASFTVPAGTPFMLSTARRYDLILRPRVAGVYPVEVEFRNWVSGQVTGKVETTINVTRSAYSPVPNNVILIND